MNTARLFPYVKSKTGFHPQHDVPNPTDAPLNYITTRAKWNTISHALFIFVTTPTVNSQIQIF